MNDVIRELVRFVEAREEGPIVRASMEAVGARTVRSGTSYIALRLWACGLNKQSLRESLKDASTRRRQEIQDFISSNGELSRLFWISVDFLEFRPEIDLDERLAIATYVNENYHPSLDA